LSYFHELGIGHAVIETPEYLADATAAGLSEAERMRVVDRLSSDPMAGDEIPGTGGARKIRLAGRGKGKSGGYRVIAFYSGADVPVFLLNVFSKGDRIDLTQAERNALRKELAELVKDYKNGPWDHGRRR
jgi:hypothetical protein